MKRKYYIPVEKMNKEFVDNLYKLETPTPYEVITMKCFDCCAYAPGQSEEFFRESKRYVIECSSSCPLCKYLNGAEFGKKMTKPEKRKYNISDEQRQAARDRMKAKFDAQKYGKLA